MPAKKIIKDDDVKFSLRIPRDIRQWLEVEAHRERRSVNAHILRLLQTIKEKQERSPDHQT